MHRLLIMISIFHHNSTTLSEKTSNAIFLIRRLIKVIFEFNKLKIKGGGEGDILLNSGKEVISF